MDDVNRDGLETSLRDFEPVFWVGPWGDSLERLYEPDGTLYAICLDGPVELTTDRRCVRINRGDLVIIPPAVAIDVTPSARWFGLVYTGPYPYHFRERFIQVWGFEHQPVSQICHGQAVNDLRHRIYYLNSARDFSDGSNGFRIQLHLPDDREQTQRIDVRWAGPSESVPFDESEGSVYFDIPLESVYLKHREAAPQQNPSRTMSPEFKPDSKV